MKYVPIILLSLITIFHTNVQAQFDINGQLLRRGELRNGFGKLIPNKSEPAAFVTQRTRIQASYKTDKLEFYTSIQDIRLWGNTAQVKLSDEFLSLHEGWAQLRLDSNWSLKLGRQELNYDNARFLGNLDWAMQARAHDFLLIKREAKNQKLHIGGGFNQNAETLTENVFTLNNQYKTAQMLWYNYKVEGLDLSFLFWNNGLQAFKKDSLNNVIWKDMRYTQTIGIPKLTFGFWKDNTWDAFAYYQRGIDINNKDVAAYDISIQNSHVIKLKKIQDASIKLTLGVEMLSGTNNNEFSKNNSFSPMYSTAHVHNGYQDFFYAGGRHEKNVGLNDLFLRIKYAQAKKWYIVTDIHQFMSNAKVYKSNVLQSNQLGTEIDITGGIVFSKDVSLQLGYSQMFGTSTFNYIQKINTPKDQQNWFYAMLIIRPKSDKKFIGVML